MVEIEVEYEGDLRTRAVHVQSGEELETDAPLDNNGKGEKFSPTDLVAVALGTCILTVIGIAAKRLGVDISGARLRIKKEMKTSPSRMIAKLDVDAFFPGEVEATKQQQLEKAAMTCPVHASLHPDVQQNFTFHWGQK